MARRAGGQTYSFPIYCASWLPLAHILKPSPSAEVTADADASAASSPSPPPPPMAVLGAGSDGGWRSRKRRLLKRAAVGLFTGIDGGRSCDCASKSCGSHSHESETDLAMLVGDFLENGGSGGGESRGSSDSESGLSDLAHIADKISVVPVLWCGVLLVFSDFWQKLW